MKASVIIPNLNGAGWLRDSIESIWAQTEQDFELIVIDNGSTDESLEIARSYCGRDRYTLIENAENTGFSHAVNQGIAIAKGEYMALFNNDAFAEPTWLAELLRTAEAVRDELPRLEASLDALRAQEEKSRQDAADAVREAQETRQRAQAELRDLFPPGRAADVLEEREYKTGLLSRERVLVATDPDAVASAVQRADAVARTLDNRDAERQEVARMREQVAQLMRERDAAVDRAAQEHFDAVLGRALTVPDIAEQVRECSWSDRAREQLCISRADAARIEHVLREDADRDRDAAAYQSIIQTSRHDRQLHDALVRSGVCPDVERRQSHEHSLSL